MRVTGHVSTTAAALLPGQCRRCGCDLAEDSHGWRTTGEWVRTTLLPPVDGEEDFWALAPYLCGDRSTLHDPEK